MYRFSSKINEFVSTTHVIFPKSLALLFKGCQVVLIPDALTRKEEGGKNWMLGDDPCPNQHNIPLHIFKSEHLQQIQLKCKTNKNRKLAQQ